MRTHYFRTAGDRGSDVPTRIPRRSDERGEGVISAAIAVLIMAFIGVGMWVAFNNNISIDVHGAMPADLGI